MNPEMTLLYVHGQQIGYGRTGVFLADELRRRDIDVYDDHGHHHESKWSKGEVETDGHTPPPSPTNLICWVSVPSHVEGYYDGQHKAILTMFESRRLPEAFRESLHEFDTVLVPSDQNVELFGEYHDNVQLIHLGVDPTLWHYREAQAPTSEFRFMIAGRGARKGTDLAYKAFCEVFPMAQPLNGGPIPKLIMKSLRGHGDFYRTGIQHVTGLLTPDAEADLYESIHCYIQPSRGEGFGLQPLQAIAMGRPTILTEDHGHAAFADLGVPISSVPEPSEYFIYGDAGEWWEPNFEELCEGMFDVYNNWEAHAEKAKASAQVVAEKFTWANVADRFQEILGEQIAKPYSGTETWQEIERLLFRIRMKQDWSGDIGSRSLTFKAGVDYWETADVKRIFFDAGLLDNDCLDDDDHGLAPVQVAQMFEYKENRAACPLCGQFPDKPSRADLLYEKYNAEALAEGRP